MPDNPIGRTWTWEGAAIPYGNVSACLRKKFVVSDTRHNGTTLNHKGADHACQGTRNPFRSEQRGHLQD